jgi:uncharacterized protein YdaU (DUF1376 family)
MSRMDWHPRYHRAALDGMERMTLAERGAYTTLLDMIYDRAGPVPDEDRMLAGIMLVSVRAWKAMRARLIELGKIEPVETPHGQALHNWRAMTELENQSKRSRKNAESGAKGGVKSGKSRTKLKGFNDNDEAPAEAKPKLKTETETEGSEDKSSDAERVVAIDHDGDAWRQAVAILTAQGGMTVAKARPFFGRLLSTNKLEPRDLLPSLAKATVTGTQDPQGYLAKAAEAIARRRTETGTQKRVGWV